MLIGGAHENNTDSMMVLHGRQSDRSLFLFSIPRDLYYQGRKINEVYRTYGPTQLVEDIATITGLSIDRYVVIDMYAFIAAIDILGGVQVELSEDLIDPTMKIKDVQTGEWGTLYYPAGTYRFSGIEALRIARSRHTSDDYSRAARQQLIITAIVDRVQALDVTNLGTVYELVQSLLSFVDTNLNAVEIVDLVRKYRNAALERQIVLNDTNVLYHTYSNLYYLGKTASEVGDGFFKGAWIQLPKDNDWNVIRWFVRSVIEGDMNERYSAAEADG